MSNWFKKAQSFEEDIPEQVGGQEDIRYRVVVPIDITAKSVGDDFANRSFVYGTLKTMFDVGSERIKDLHRGINIMLNLSDIKKYDDILREEGL